MNNMTRFVWTFLAIVTLFTKFAQAEDLVIRSEDGEEYVLDVDKDASFFEVMNDIHYLLGEKEDSAKEFSFNYDRGLPTLGKKSKNKSVVRNYGLPVSSADKQQIRYIITSLAKYNWMQLAKEESSLKKAGDKIAHVHPFRFLQCIFTDEEMKAAIFVVRNKSLVWGDYFSGLKKSMNEESDINNVIQFTPDFAAQVGISLDSILPFVQNRMWSELVDTLINTLPRQGDPGRYNI
jgi:hypothetical protein